MSSRTTPYDVQHVPGYPDALQIYRIPASRFWQMRMFVDGSYVRRSTRAGEKKRAIEKAKEFYDTVRLHQRADINVHTHSFRACAEHLMKRQASLVAQDQRDQRIVTEDRKKLDRDILPFFGSKDVATITTSLLEDYIEELTSKRKLSPSTLSKHMVVIRKVLNEARKRQFVGALPPFPTVARRDNPRPYFDIEEYRKIRETAKKLATQGIKIRYVPLDMEIHDLIKFHVNVFVRISDIKLLKHKHISVFKEGKTKYLLISPPKSKTIQRASASMPAAVDVYEDLVQRHSKRDRAEPDDFVFYPDFENREYALQTMRRQFEHVVRHGGMKFDKFDKPRTLYSLRHTALMLRLLRGDKVDIFLLARNALTSVDQLERFYLSHAESRMMIENLQSIRTE